MLLKDTLLSLSQNQRLHNFVVHNGAARSLSRRFVAGETLDEAIEASNDLNTRTIQVALDFLGENVADEHEARMAAQSYMAAVQRIQQTEIDANLSVKLTALGLDISQDLCEQQLRTLLESAQRSTIFVCVDMEGSDYTERTIAMVMRLHREFAHVGTVIQSCLRRSAGDIEQLVQQGVRVRLVKGAYKELPKLAFQRKQDVDEQYVHIMGRLLARGNYPAIATHDAAIIQAACSYARDHGISKQAFEFQMLYGIRRDLQQKLVEQGYHVRVYVPYGTHWYPYLVRRMAERPANLMFVLSNVLR